MELESLTGLAAATLTTASFVPQALHSLRTRDVSGISLGMYSMFTSGVGLWLLYGILLRAWPIVVANAVTLVLAGIILWLKIGDRRRNSSAAVQFTYNAATKRHRAVQSRQERSHVQALPAPEIRKPVERRGRKATELMETATSPCWPGCRLDGRDVAPLQGLRISLNPFKELHRCEPRSVSPSPYSPPLPCPAPSPH